MPNRNFDNITSLSLFNKEIIADGDLFITKIDTINYDKAGINFHAGCTPSNYTDGLYKFQLVQSDILDTFAYGTIPEEDIIGDTSDYPYLKDLEITGSLATAQGFPFIQVKNLKRFVTINIIASGVTTGAYVTILLNMARDEEPVNRAGDILDSF